MRILVYDDSLDFGGHQVMACRGVEALTEDPKLDVVMISNLANRRLAERTADIPDLVTVRTRTATRRFQGVRNRLNPGAITKLQQHFRELNAGLIVCIQGDVEQSSMALLAGHRSGIPCISYLALPHRLQDMRACAGGLRDRANQYLLNLPDRYITLSESMRQLLLARGVQKPIAIVPNGIPQPAHIDAPPRENDHSTIGILGRIEFKQKQQDFMVRTFCSAAETFNNCRLVITGSGPDEDVLRKLVRGCPRPNDIALQPWTDNIEAFFSAIDFLIIPSRYEGVPLVMLEALARGIPVIGSACDGMAEMLPADWLFHPGDAASLAETFARVRSSPQEQIIPLQEMISNNLSIDRFKQAFHDEIVGARQPAVSM